ncbi:MAG: hypothetical protein AAF614_35040 [Chloroflexota bacterium]
MPKKTIFSFLIVCLFLVISMVAIAQPSGSFDLSWSTIDGGGGSITGGNFTLNGTIGQVDAAVLSGGNFDVNGGFWQCLTASVASPGISPNGSGIDLNWIGSSSNIYRAINDPYFTPTTPYASDVSPIWIDGGTLGSVSSNYTYVIRATGDCGESGNSQRLAEFDFDIVPGS